MTFKLNCERTLLGKKTIFDALYDRQRQIIYQKTGFRKYLSYEIDFVELDFSLNLVKSEK